MIAISTTKNRFELRLTFRLTLWHTAVKFLTGLTHLGDVSAMEKRKMLIQHQAGLDLLAVKYF